MKVAIIGAGVIGNRLARVFTSAEIEIKWICDVDKEKAEKLVVEYGGRATDKLDDVLVDGDVGIVYVGVPPKYHKDIVLRALESGKHVICEKPIALSAKDGEEMALAAEKSGKQTTINLPFRFTTGVKRMKELLSEGFVGDIRRLELRFRFPQWPRSWQNVEWLKTKEQGGALREVGTHYFFLLGELEEFIGKPTRLIAANEYTGEQGCERSSVGMIEFDSGLTCTLDLLTGTADEEENTLRITGDKQTLSFRRWYILEDKDGNVLCDTRESSEGQMVREFMRFSPKNSLVTFEQATQAQRIMESIHNSGGNWVEIRKFE